MAGGNEQIRTLRALVQPFDPVFELFGHEKPSTQFDILDIDYEALRDAAWQLGNFVHSALDDTLEQILDLRSEVAAHWQGHAASSFDDYAFLVADALERERTLISGQQSDVDTMAAELETAIKGAYNAVLDAAQTLVGLVTPAAALTMAVVRAAGGDNSPNLNLAFDLIGAIAAVLTGTTSAAIGILAAHQRTMASFAQFERFNTAGGASITEVDREGIVDHNLERDGNDPEVDRTGLDEESLAEGSWQPAG